MSERSERATGTAEVTPVRAGVARRTLSKVPEVTVWFWIIKILCTTVGETFADWIDTSLGFGLVATALLFTVVLAAVMVWQLRLSRYVPFVYWLAVVVVSVTGTLYTDILTDQLNVPLAASTGVFAVLLAVVFGIWYAREATLSIHSIVTLPRELFYWLAVLVTFALGTAAGDWTLQLTGWGPGTSVLLPAGLIVAVVVGWRFGANAVLSFWLAYILTRPLGANLGDWFASPASDHGLGVGTSITSVVFLAAILAVVGYLTFSRSDVIVDPERNSVPVVTTDQARERVMLGYYAVVAVAATSLLVWASAQPHASVSDEPAAAPASVTLAPGRSASAHFPAAEIAKFRTVTQDTLSKVQSGQQAAATARIKDLETAWDQDQDTLQPMDGSDWDVLDGKIDRALKALRAKAPDSAAETQALDDLLTALG
ncbi:COG4705 family protein [Nocardia stercoris]|uniref:Membrane-anchored protein n=1 Tax=Nocardia stercoris TaxID=2483361 RepID=A0A3M2L2R8_9NOCA|nr:hypothetical protein [Nocardia stercoris]RMI31947.1 hypothetical protein EBN03_16155 [Nocardia stercoris]